MKTTFPTLSYKPTGFSLSGDTHSSAYTTRQTYPRTDLTHFNPWHTFAVDIHHAITSRMAAMNIASGAEYDIGSMPKKRKIVSSEEDVRSQAEVQLHDLVVEVLDILGIEGRFERPGSANNQVVGSPDFSWLRNPIKHPKMVVRVSPLINLTALIHMVQAEYKTVWDSPLEDLPGYFQRSDHHNVRERQSIEAVHQLYGYMTFNDNKYGVLNNMQYAWFFQRTETPDCKGKTLQYYGPVNFDIDSIDSPNMLKAFVGIILLAETVSTWFHTFPTDAEVPPGRYFGKTLTATHNRDAAIAQAQSYSSTPMNGSYPVLPLDPKLCHFNRTSVRHAPRRGCTVKALLARGVLAGGNLDVFCKIVDVFQNPDAVDALDREVRNYAALQHIQNIAIPQVRGYYDVWGLLKLLALKDVGTAIPENAPITTRTRQKMRSALTHIHTAGYIHGDIARRNFCKKGHRVYLVDLESLMLGDAVEMQAELAAVDAL